MASRRQRFQDDAAAAALVSYGPRLSALRALIGESDENYRRALHQSQAGQASTQRAVSTALGQLRGIYGDAPIPGLAGLGRSQAMESMTERGLLAAERAQSSRGSALEILRSDRGKIAAERRDIAQEIGAFTSSEAGKLAEAASQRDLRNRISLRSQRTSAANSRRSSAQSERNSLRSAGINPDTGLPIPGGKLDPKAKPKGGASGKDEFGNTRDQRIGRRSDFRKIVSDAREMTAALKTRKQQGKYGGAIDPATIAQLIGPDYRKTNIDLVKGAVQQAVLGYVGDKTSKRLRRLGVSGGYRVGRRNAATPNRRPTANVAPGPGVGSRPT